MIEYVIANNPDDRVLNKASKALREGKLICLPTDTSWIVIADPFSKKGVERLYRYKNAEKLKHFSLLCDTISRASEVAVIDDNVFRMINKKIPGHFTFIFEATKKITRAVQANKTDREVGLRFVPSILVQKLIETHGDVLISSHLDKPKMGLSEEDEVLSYQIEDSLSAELSMILDPGDYEFAGASTIVDFTTGAPEIIRQGVGSI